MPQATSRIKEMGMSYIIMSLFLLTLMLPVDLRNGYVTLANLGVVGHHVQRLCVRLTG